LTFDWSNYEFISYFENSVALNHISEDHTLLRKSSHTHTLYELSRLLKNFYLQGNLCSLITWLFFICLRIFDKLSDYFLRFRYICVLNSCWSPNLVIFLCLFLWKCLVIVFLLYSIYPLSFWDKMGSIFCFWTGNVFPNRSSVFLSQNG
jgi:hypothetical protein